MTGPAGQVREIRHWVDGKEHNGSSGNAAPVTNPATGEITGRVSLADATDARAAIASAKAAFPAWRDLSLTKRTQIIFRFRELLNERKPQVRISALAALEFRKLWRPGQAEMVLAALNREQVPEIRIAAINALAKSRLRLIGKLPSYMCRRMP